MKVSAKVVGLDEVLSNLDKQYGKTKVNKATKEALEVSGRLAKVRLQQAMSKFQDTGRSRKEVVSGNVKTVNGIKKVKVGWSGDGAGQRWRLVHLNEFGYSPHGVFSGRSNATDSGGYSFYKPRGYHAIQDAFDNMVPEIKQLQITTLKRYLSK